MRSLGVDPGTMSFDFCLMDSDGSVVEELTIASAEIMEHPERLADVTRRMKADIVVGPSGYGVPLCLLREAGDDVLAQLLPADEGEVAVNEGIRSALRLLRDERVPVVFTPGVLHLGTVPAFRKHNRFDMGTADKLAVTFLVLANRVQRTGRGPEGQTFAVLELGYGFTAAVAVLNGRVVDGIGGSMSFGGYHSRGFIDSELAYRFGRASYLELIFGCGAADLAGHSPIEEWPPDSAAAASLVESALKTLYALLPVLGPGHPVVLSGRISEVSWLRDSIGQGISAFGPLERITGRATQVKAAAEGAARLGLALLGGEEAPLAVHLGIVTADRIPLL